MNEKNLKMSFYKSFQLLAIDNDPLMCPMEKEQRKRLCLTFSLQNIGSLDKFRKYYPFFTMNLIIGYCTLYIILYIHILVALLFRANTANLDDYSGLLQNSTPPINIPGPQLSNSISGKYAYIYRYMVLCRFGQMMHLHDNMHKH